MQKALITLLYLSDYFIYLFTLSIYLVLLIYLFIFYHLPWSDGQP